jgi:beta-glucanase (GH16 family)
MTEYNKIHFEVLVCAIYVISLFFFRLNAQSTQKHLIWSDEFEYTGTPDPANWSYDIGGDGWGNNEEQYYTDRPENVHVENGKLIITALKEDYNGNNYTSARIVTKNKGDWLYGRIEVMAKIPEGRGTWAAIWMLPTDWEYGGWPYSGEIDIMEHVGYDMGTVYGTIHVELYNGMLGTQKGGHMYINDVHTAFHEYAIEWTEDTLYFFIDDNQYFEYPNYHTGSDRWPYDKRFHLLMNIAIGGNWGGIEGIDNSIFPQSMEIEYVRVYQIFQKHEIKGPDRVTINQENITFSLTEYEGASYNWMFPDGVEIISGQGTGSITVNWGAEKGMVTVIQSLGEESFTSTLDVSLISVPEEDLIINGNETGLGTWSQEPGTGNTIQMTYEE